MVLVVSLVRVIGCISIFVFIAEKMVRLFLVVVLFRGVVTLFVLSRSMLVRVL
nr:MAG TPA: hypothetical protein [Microviridae sp.]